MRRIAILLPFFIAAFSFSFTCLAQGGTPTLPRGGYVPGELIIHVASPLTTQEAEDHFQMIGLPVNATQLTLDGTYFLIKIDLRGPRPNPQLDLIQETFVERFMCEEIEGNPGEGSTTEVDGIWPNYVVDPGDLYVNDALGGATGSSCFVVDADAYNPLGNCPVRRELPNPPVEETKVSVAIMDTGLNPFNFPHLFSDLSEGVSIVNWHPVEATDYMDSPPGVDVNGHGTAVAALVAHRFYETEKLDHLQLHSFPILNEHGKGTVAALINSLDQAITQEVDIINLSLGFVRDECDENVSALLTPLFIRAEAAEILIFTSAGNDGVGLAEHPQYPANSSPSFPLLFTVGASRCADESTWIKSNFDKNIVDFTAPGQNITVPYPKDGCYILASGTSFASPLSASIAAALRSNHSASRTACMLESRIALPNGGPIPGADESRLGSISFLESTFSGECEGGGGVATLANFSETTAVFPNPVGSVLNVPVTEEEIATKATLGISDLGGRNFFQAQANSPLIKVSTKELPAGVYVLSVTNGKKTRVVKIIKH
ncbi:MAG: S8 family serine peptidase [Lewinella sp.]